MRLIGGGIREFRADQVGDLLRKLLGDQNPPAERGVAGIGEGQIGLHGGHAIPGSEHAEAIREILDGDLGAQFVDAELVGERLGQRARAVDQETAAMAGRRLGDQEIRNDLALRRQQRPETAEPRPHQLRYPW